MTHDRDEFRRRAVRAALTVAGIAAAIGLVIGLLTAGVVYLSGAVPEDTGGTVAAPRADPEDEIPSPVLSPTASPPSSKSPAASPSPSATAEGSREARSASRRNRQRAPRARAVTLRAGETRAGRYDRVALRGRYVGGNGRTLAVQRLEGGSWRPFPTSATVRGGTFSTYVASGRPGPNRFRVLDRATGRTSNVVVVRVG